VCARDCELKPVQDQPKPVQIWRRYGVVPVLLNPNRRHINGLSVAVAGIYTRTPGACPFLTPPRDPRRGMDIYTPTPKLMIKPSELQIAAYYSEAAYGDRLCSRVLGNDMRLSAANGSGLIRAGRYDGWASATFFWVEAGDRNYLAFRGTADPSDILLDICIFPSYYLGAWVHSGMALAHKSIKKKILKVLRKMDPSKPLVITGHSMGGSLGELTHLLCQREGIESKCITFGKPRAFLRPLKKRFPKNSMFSVVSASDLITRLPRYLFNHGCSDQNLFYLASDGNSYLNPEMSFVRDDFKLHRGISDHSMTTYKESLDRIS